MPRRPRPPMTYADFKVAPYWYTLADCRLVIGCSLRTLMYHLPRVPAKHKVKVTRRVRGTTNTRYWRISPDGLALLGRLTRMAPYLTPSEASDKVHPPAP